MKLKGILMAAAMIVAGAFSPKANAQPNAAWLCQMDFEGTAAGLQVVIGSFGLNATGDLRCMDPVGQTLVLPIKVKMESGPIAPRVAIGSFDVVGQTAEISLLNNEPHDMLGRYYVTQAQGAIIAGAGVITGVRVGIPDLSIQVSLQFLRGLGLNFGISSMDIELDETRL